jgi:hypothetical protein
MSDNTDNTDNTDNVSAPLSFFINDTTDKALPVYPWSIFPDDEEEEDGTKLDPFDRSEERDKRRREEINMYASNYRIMRILCNAAERKAEKESCRPGCYGAKQKFEETLDEMLSCDFKSDNEEDEEDEEDGEDINVVVEKPNDEKVDWDADRVTDSGEIDASGNKTHIYSFALRPQGSVSQKDQIAKLHKPFKKNNKLFKKK